MNRKWLLNRSQTQRGTMSDAFEPMEDDPFGPSPSPKHIGGGDTGGYFTGEADKVSPPLLPYSSSNDASLDRAIRTSMIEYLQDHPRPSSPPPPTFIVKESSKPSDFAQTTATSGTDTPPCRTITFEQLMQMDAVIESHRKRQQEVLLTPEAPSITVNLTLSPSESTSKDFESSPQSLSRLTPKAIEALEEQKPESGAGPTIIIKGTAMSKKMKGNVKRVINNNKKKRRKKKLENDTKEPQDRDLRRATSPSATGAPSSTIPKHKVSKPRQALKRADHPRQWRPGGSPSLLSPLALSRLKSKSAHSREENNRENKSAHSNAIVNDSSGTSRRAPSPSSMAAAFAAKRRIREYVNRQRQMEDESTRQSNIEQRRAQDAFRSELKARREAQVKLKIEREQKTMISRGEYTIEKFHAPSINPNLSRDDSYGAVGDAVNAPSPAMRAGSLRIILDNADAITEYERVHRKFNWLYDCKPPKTPGEVGKRNPSAKAPQYILPQDTDYSSGRENDSIASGSKLPQRASQAELRRLSTLAVETNNDRLPRSSLASLGMPLDDLESLSSKDTESANIPNHLRSFEHALVIGISDSTVSGAVENNDYGIFDPQILASFPPDKPLALEALSEFAFPSGAELKKLPTSRNRKSTVSEAASCARDPREALLLFDTTASDFENEDDDSDSLSSGSGIENAPRIKTSTLYGVLLQFVFTKTIVKKSTWGTSEVSVQVPRAILFLSKNAYLPIHFQVLRHCAKTWGTCSSENFVVDDPAASSPLNGGHDKSKSSWFFSTSSSVATANKSSEKNSNDNGWLDFDEIPSRTRGATSIESWATTRQNPFDDDYNNAPDFNQPPINLSKQQVKRDKSLFDLLTRYQNFAMPATATQTVRFQLLPGNNSPESLIHFRRARSIDSISIGSDQPTLSRLTENDSNDTLALEWALPTLLKYISLDNLLLVLGCAMTEMQVVCCCPDVSVLSCCVVAIVSLLRPLKWACPIIVTLPSSLHIYLESPVPVVLGVTSLPPNHQPPPGQVVVQVMSDKVDLNEEEMSAYHTLILPKLSSLHHDLAPHAGRLESEVNGSAASVLEGEMKVKRPISPVYANTDISSALQLSMRRFVTLTKTHLSMLVSSAVELEQEREQQREQDEAMLQKVSTQQDSPTPELQVSISKSNERQWWEQRLGGEAGIAFIERMMDSQMYNSYSLDLKCEMRRERKRRLHSADASDASDDLSFGELPDSMPASQQRGFRRRATATFSDNFHSRNSVSEEIMSQSTKDSQEAKLNDRRYSSKALRRRSVAMEAGLGFDNGTKTENINIQKDLIDNDTKTDL